MSRKEAARPSSRASVSTVTQWKSCHLMTDKRGGGNFQRDYRECSSVGEKGFWIHQEKTTVHIGYIDNYCHPICRQNFNLKQVFVIVKREDAPLLPSLKWLDQPVPYK